MESHKDIRVYLSGPMFSPADLWEMNQIADVVEKAGYPTYLPQRDGIEVGKVEDLLKGHPVLQALGQTILAPVMQAVRKAIFAWDMYNVVERCQVLVLNLNGRVPDGGSLVEASTAWAAGKPLMIYKDTPISAFAGYDNPMISGLCYTWKYTGKIAEIPAGIEKCMQDFPASPYQGGNVPPKVRLVCEAGKDIGHILEILRGKHDDLWELAKNIESEAKALESFRRAFPD